MLDLQRSLRRLCSFAALVAVLGAAACNRTSGERNQEPPTGKRPNIVFAVVDTLRADALGVYGNPRRNSPTLDGIAAEGVAFEQAISPAPWTQPAMASLFSSCYPGVHQVLDYNLAVDISYNGAPKVSVFSDGFTTLAEALQAGGYATAGIVANPFLHREYGFAQGFEHYDTSFANNTTPGSRVNDAAIAWLRQRDTSRPFFLYLHYMDVHGPYNAGPEFLDPLLDAVEGLPRKHALSKTERVLPSYLRKPPERNTNWPRHRRLARYREYWVARYEAGVREVDHYIGELQSQLGEMGLWDGAYVVVTADHGEALCEHGLWDHGFSLHGPELHVPLILRWPRMLPAGKHVPQPARLIDVMPTLLDQLGLDLPSGMQGASLVPYIEGRPPAESPVIFAEAVKLGPEQKAVQADGWKLIVTADSHRDELYDLTPDPEEQADLSAQQPQQLSRLRSLLDVQVASNQKLAGAETKHAELSPEQAERLRSLGYGQ